MKTKAIRQEIPLHEARCNPCGDQSIFRRFLRAKDGSMIVFGLFIFIAILLVSGLAVDFMRYESNRMRVQATADRAALAAATLREQGDNTARKAMVEEYFAVAGLSDFLDDVEVKTSLNAAEVIVHTRPAVNTFFMRWVGIDALASTERSVAYEDITNVEISLVLDISGSMRWNDSDGMPRISRLRGAATNFVSTVLNPDSPDTTTISIVPYAGSVNPGKKVFELLGGTPWHDYSHCPDLPRSVFNSSGLPNVSSIPQAAHFMFWAVSWAEMDWGWCPNENNSILYHSSNEEQLHEYLSNMRLHDGTGTHYGIRWGLALLDPAGQWLTTELADASIVDDIHIGRPAMWDEPETLKVIVLMTDGLITEQMRPRRNGTNSIFGRNGIYPTSNEQDTLNSTHIQGLSSGWRTQITSRNNNADDFDSACQLAKDNGVIIFTIAFETNTQGQNEMRKCASGPSRFFNANGLDLDNAFAAIAASIQTLRLTQ